MLYNIYFDYLQFLVIIKKSQLTYHKKEAYYYKNFVDFLKIIVLTYNCSMVMSICLKLVINCKKFETKLFLNYVCKIIIL